MCFICWAVFRYLKGGPQGSDNEDNTEGPLGDQIVQQAMIAEPTARRRVFLRCIRVLGLGSHVRTYTRGMNAWMKKSFGLL